MVSQKVKVNNLIGLHLRPAGKLCNEAMRFKCLITFSYKEVTANAKSVLSVLGACVRGGDTIELRDNVTAGGVKTVATKKSASGKSNDKTIRYSTRRRTD